MTADNPTTDGCASLLRAEVLETSSVVTLEELCVTCHAETDWIAELVEQGAIEPVGRTRSEWQFTSLSIVRVAKAKRLERDLSLNLAGVALALELLDEIDDLRARLKVFETLTEDANEDRRLDAS